MADWKAWALYRSCGRKRIYRHEGQARREAHKRGMHWYACKHCDGFHLTKRSQDAQ